MSVRRGNVGKIVSFMTVGTLLAGCAQTPLGPTVQVMPGPGKSFDAFQADVVSCKGFASSQVQGQAEASNQRAVGAAVLGTVLGAGLGAAVGGGWGAAGQGAGVGAAAGAASGTAVGADMSANDQLNIQVQYDNAFSQCMYAKGDQVPGFAPAAPQVAIHTGPDPSLVRAVQGELVRLSYLKDTPDGVQGQHTHAAIVSFETANGMPADGYSSPKLLAKLQSTPTSAASTTASAPAPANWVAPGQASTPASTASSGNASAPAAPANWVAPTKTP